MRAKRADAGRVMTGTRVEAVATSGRGESALDDEAVVMRRLSGRETKVTRLYCPS
jgi:hypothetical protein